MKLTRSLPIFFVTISIFSSLHAQQSASAPIVPTLVNFAGTALNAQGKPVAGVAGVTFSIYKDQSNGAPLWMETQSVHPDAKGNYSVQLGATTAQGLPLDLFASGEARWLGVRVEGAEEQPRVLLLSVPYALKAADAQTLGGLPPSAFVLAAPTVAGSLSNAQPAMTVTTPSATPAVGGTGTANSIPIWTDSTDLGNSIISQVGTGTTAKIGINEKTPVFTLDVGGQELVRGLFELSTLAFATKTQAYNSNALNFESSAFSSSTSKATVNHFQWQAEATGNNTTTPGATLNLLYGTDPNAPAETGLKLSNKGVFTFAAGQTFPGSGSVTSVGLSAPSSDFTVSGSPVTTAGTLALAWKVAPTNANTVNAIVKRDSSGSFSASNINASGNVIAGGEVSGNTVFGLEVFGENPDGGEGILGLATGTSGQGVWGESDGTLSFNGNGPDGLHGVTHADTGSGVAGLNDSNLGFGVYGQGNNVGVYGLGGAGVYGQDFFSNSFGIYGIGDNSGSYAGYFVGNVFISGTLSNSIGSLKIDHPLDPANKYLSHSFVQSPDMMDVYNGNVILDANGEGIVTLPDWFEALNRDYRYQLTSIGGFAPIYIAQKVQGNAFRIAGGKAGMEVSWQVTGIRQDAYANAHRIPVEEDKEAAERGYYLHPELFGAPVEKRMDWAHHPEMMKHLKEQHARPVGRRAAPVKPLAQ